jgi:predicted acylesterase/phospholipase RssA
MSKTIVCLSGGADKIPFHYGAMEAIVSKEQEVHGIMGCSSGSIIASVYAMGLMEEVEEIILNFRNSQILDRDISKWYNTVRAVWGFAVRGKDYLYSHKALRRTLENFITKDAFRRYQNDPKSIDCWIGCTLKSSKQELFKNLKVVASYEEAMDIIEASASIPIVMEPMMIKDNSGVLRRAVDLGLTSHIPLEQCVEIYKDDLTNIIGVHTTKADYEIENIDSVGGLSYIQNLYEWIVYTINKNDRKIADYMTKSIGSGINIYNIHPDGDLTSKLFKSTYKDKKEWKKRGYSKTIEVLKDIK